MQLFILIQTETATRSVAVSAQESITRDVLSVLAAEEAGATLRSNPAVPVAIKIETLLDLRIHSHISVIDGVVLDHMDDSVDALAQAQVAAREKGARVFLATQPHQGG